MMEAKSAFSKEARGNTGSAHPFFYGKGAGFPKPGAATALPANCKPTMPLIHA
jgi:hypothetical protein